MLKHSADLEKNPPPACHGFSKPTKSFIQAENTKVSQQINSSVDVQLENKSNIAVSKNLP